MWIVSTFTLTRQPCRQYSMSNVHIRALPSPSHSHSLHRESSSTFSLQANYIISEQTNYCQNARNSAGSEPQTMSVAVDCAVSSVDIFQRKRLGWKKLPPKNTFDTLSFSIFFSSFSFSCADVTQPFLAKWMSEHISVILLRAYWLCSVYIYFE